MLQTGRASAEYVHKGGKWVSRVRCVCVQAGMRLETCRHSIVVTGGYHVVNGIWYIV